MLRSREDRERLAIRNAPLRIAPREMAEQTIAIEQQREMVRDEPFRPGGDQRRQRARANQFVKRFGPLLAKMSRDVHPDILRVPGLPCRSRRLRLLRQRSL